MKYFQELVDIVSVLRSENGCDWDREQTYDTIKPHLTEESYEVIDTIVDKNFSSLKEELGDLMLQIILLSQIAKEDNYFSIEDVLKGINKKLIRRHPHIFADSNANGSKEILNQWERIKAEERKEKNKEKESILSGVPKSIPAMNAAYRLMDKAAHIGFEYKNIDDSLSKVKEEFLEMVEAYNEAKLSGDKEHLEEEIGDLIMTVIDFARMNKIDAEGALLKTNKKFTRRFNYIEKSAKESGKDIYSMTLEEMDTLWNEAKKKGN